MKYVVAFLVLLGLCAIAVASRPVVADRTITPSDWKVLRESDQTKPVKFIVALKQRNLDLLERKFWSVSDPTNEDYGNFLTTEQITAMIAPPQEDHDVVVEWLRSFGVEPVSHGDSLEAVTTVDVAEDIFETEFVDYIRRGTSHIVCRALGAVTVPHHIGKLVDLVSGLTEFPIGKIRPKRARPTMMQGYPVVVPQTISKVYNIPAGTTGSQGSQGVIEFEDQYFSPDDLATFASQTGVSITPPSADHIIGYNDPSNPQIEATLDIQYVAGVGLGVENWFWIEGDNVWVYGFAVHLFQANQGPLVASISYGWSEEDQCEYGIGGDECNKLGVDTKGYVARTNTEFQKIGVKGISLFVSSGDSGAHGRTDPGCTQNHFNPDYPGASPYITSVGATQVQNPQTNLPNAGPICRTGQWSCISGGTEVAVSYDVARFTSGGGFSNVGMVQDYQKAAVSAYLSNPQVQLPPASYYNQSGRGYPDVAAFGNAVLITTEGYWEPVGGTSASAPIFAGVVALLNSAVIASKGHPLGFMNPLLYQAQASRPATFTDVTVGSNACTEGGCSSSCKGFNAARGWDPVTGLGTPNYQELLAYINSL